jgi:hypothetical protein
MPIRRLHENHRVKLVVFGSTGGTGRELVRQALELGHESRRLPVTLRRWDFSRAPPYIEGDALRGSQLTLR